MGGGGDGQELNTGAPLLAIEKANMHSCTIFVDYLKAVTPWLNNQIKTVGPQICSEEKKRIR